MKTTAEWKTTAKLIIQAEMKRRGVSAADLAQRLEANERTVANKIATGAFSAVFLLQVMAAIGVRNLQIDDSGD